MSTAAMPRDNHDGLSRRDFLARSLALGGLALAAGQDVAQAQGAPTVAAQPSPSGTRVVLLGTAGGPTPNKLRSAPSQVIVVNDALYVVDCGNGVARQLVLADLSLGKIRHTFITHHHDDHNADYGNLLLLAWALGPLTTRVDTWGPPPLEAMTGYFLQQNAYDIDLRTAQGGGRPSLASLIHPHEISEGGVVMEDENVKVTATLVNHPPVVPAFGYRFDAADRSIVISGDTTLSDNLIALAQGADVLVHAALYLPGFGDLSPERQDGLTRIHTRIEDVGKVAAAASVKTLVLSHFLPPANPAVTDQMWMDGARANFDGEVIVGKDLLAV